MSDSEDSMVTYTEATTISTIMSRSVHPPSPILCTYVYRAGIPGVYATGGWMMSLLAEKAATVLLSPLYDSPGYITESDLEEDLEEDDEDPEEDPADYPDDRDDDGEEEESSGDDADVRKRTRTRMRRMRRST
ncbi:hypothetical protein Tco_0536702 [Tanacetum coccineum]